MLPACCQVARRATRRWSRDDAAQGECRVSAKKRRCDRQSRRAPPARAGSVAASTGGAGSVGIVHRGQGERPGPGHAGYALHSKIRPGDGARAFSALVRRPVVRRRGLRHQYGGDGGAAQPACRTQGGSAMSRQGGSCRLHAPRPLPHDGHVRRRYSGAFDSATDGVLKHRACRCGYRVDFGRSRRGRGRGSERRVRRQAPLRALPLPRINP